MSKRAAEASGYESDTMSVGSTASSLFLPDATRDNTAHSAVRYFFRANPGVNKVSLVDKISGVPIDHGEEGSLIHVAVQSAAESEDCFGLMDKILEKTQELVQDLRDQSYINLFKGYKKKANQFATLKPFIEHLTERDEEGRVELLSILSDEILISSSEFLEEIEMVSSLKLQKSNSRIASSAATKATAASADVAVAADVKMPAAKKEAKALTLADKVSREIGYFEGVLKKFSKSARSEDVTEEMYNGQLRQEILASAAGDLKIKKAQDLISLRPNLGEVYDEMSANVDVKKSASTKDKASSEGLESAERSNRKLQRILSAAQLPEEESAGATKFTHYSIDRTLTPKFSVLTSERPNTRYYGRSQKDHTTAYCALLMAVINSIPLISRSRDMPHQVLQMVNLILAIPIDGRTLRSSRRSDEARRSRIEQLQQGDVAEVERCKGDYKNLNNLLKVRDLRIANEDVCRIVDEFLIRMNEEEWATFPQGKNSRKESEAVDYITKLNKVFNFVESIKQISSDVSLMDEGAKKNNWEKLLRTLRENLVNTLSQRDGTIIHGIEVNNLTTDPSIVISDPSLFVRELSTHLFELFDLSYSHLKETDQVKLDGEYSDEFMLNVATGLMERHFKIFAAMSGGVISRVKNGSEQEQGILNELVDRFVENFFQQPSAAQSLSSEKVALSGDAANSAAEFRDLFSKLKVRDNQDIADFGDEVLEPDLAGEGMFEYNRLEISRRLSNIVTEKFMAVTAQSQHLRPRSAMEKRRRYSTFSSWRCSRGSKSYY